MEEKNTMIEVSKVGECLLAEMKEVEDLQDELKKNLLEINGEYEKVVAVIREKEAAKMKLLIKEEQLDELFVEFNDEDMKEIFDAKRDKIKKEKEELDNEIEERVNKANELRNEFNKGDQQLLSLETNQNALINFGTKYGFLIKKEEEKPERLQDDEVEILG